MNPRSLITRFNKLDAPSPAIAKLLKSLGQSETDNEEVTAIIQKDPLLCGKLLAACNAPTLGLSREVGSLDQAVLLLGHGEIHRMVMGLSFGPALSTPLGGYAIEGQELWQHATLVASLSSAVLESAPHAGYDPSVAYTAGLVHDIGKILLNYVLDQPAKDAIETRVSTNGRSLMEAEKDVLGTDHAEVGACLLQDWRLPAVIVEAVAHHHAPVCKPRPELSAIIHVANVLAYETGAAAGWNAFAIRVHESAVEALRLNDEGMQRLVVAAYESLPQSEPKDASASA